MHTERIFEEVFKEEREVEGAVEEGTRHTVIHPIVLCTITPPIVFISMYFICYRARNDDLVERMNGKMKKTEDTVETVSSKIKLLEGEQEKMTSTIGGHKEIFFQETYPR